VIENDFRLKSQEKAEYATELSTQLPDLVLCEVLKEMGIMVIITTFLDPFNSLGDV